MMRNTRGVLLVASIVVVLAATGAAASFDFGITPSKVYKGVYEPGDRFFVSFFVVSGSEDPLDVKVDTARGNADEFKQLQKKNAANFSEQECKNCFQFLKSDGSLEEYDKKGSINQWKSVEFFIDVPENIEPGYHMLKVMPRPVRSSGGSVGVVSSASFPVIFRVPGEAIRSARILGVHAARTFNDQQNIVTTLYNDGTVTIVARTELIVETKDGNTTIRSGTRKLSPGDTVEVTGRIDTDRLNVENGTFNVHAVADYTTEKDRFADTLSPREPVEVPEASGAVTQKNPGSQTPYTTYLFILLFLSVTSLITWKVVQRV